eukprot:TRINITY_DN175_c1_g2_i1.p1 TRINITY_DN175_c1_g2~~TRINITY_DN175_c1_g2_i1.p1  ORF type:complete len:279 (+),score=90.78 TRINITY_DN175_c1_g2_i1:44-880(+)
MSLTVGVKGVNGFVGGYIRRLYEADGHKVVELGKETTPEDVRKHRPDIVFLCCLVPGGKEDALVTDFEGVTVSVRDVCQEVGVKLVVHVTGHGSDFDGCSTFIKAKCAADEVLLQYDRSMAIHIPILFGEGDRFTSEAFRTNQFPAITTRVSFMHVEDAVRVMKEFIEDEGLVEGPLAAQHYNITGEWDTYEGFLSAEVWGDLGVKKYVSTSLVKALAYVNSFIAPWGLGIKGLYPYVIEALEHCAENRRFAAIKHCYNKEVHRQRMEQTLEFYKEAL